MASVGGKLAGVHVTGRMPKWRSGEATIISWVLRAKALIKIVFATILFDRAIITHETFSALLLMALGSTMLTIALATPQLVRYVLTLFA